MKVLILANGQPPSSEIAHKHAHIHDKLIATDGAADIAVRLGLSPDVITGDFDSIERLDNVRVVFPNTEIVRTPDQDYGDLEKALLYAIKQGAIEITIIGAGNRLSGRGGGRVDHMLANYMLLVQYHNRVPILRIIDDWSEVRVISGTDHAQGELIIETKSGDRVSLISLVNNTVVTVTGVKWPLDNAALSVGTHAISNEAQENRVFVKIHSGVVFVCHLPGREEKTEN